ncbi:MAG: hypothetical protein H6536_04210 [Bacteroidales bacterium]|nr:hypothetical protein [Bacteroidales bacterium]
MKIKNLRVAGFPVLVLLAMLVSSCSVVKTRTAKIADVYSGGVIQKPVIVDLNVAETKVTGTAEAKTVVPVSKIKEDAVADALKKANADVLVEPIFETVKANAKTTVTVTGFPAYYKNFRLLSESDTALLRYGFYKQVKTYDATTEESKKKSGAGAVIGSLAGVGLLALILLAL